MQLLRKVWVLQFSIVISLVGGAPALGQEETVAPAQSPGDLLEGEWSIRAKATNNVEFNGLLTLRHPKAGRLSGVIRWSPGTSENATELVTGDLDAASQRMRLIGYQISSRLPNCSIGYYEGSFDATQRRIQLGSYTSIPQNLAAGTWTGKWLTKILPSSQTPPERPSDAWHLLCLNLSDGFGVSGMNIWRNPVRSELSELSLSQEATIRELGALRLGLELLRDRMMEHTQPIDQLGASVVDTVRVLGDYVSGAFSENNDITSLLRDITSKDSAIYKAERDAAGRMWISVLGLLGECQVRSEARLAAEARKLGTVIDESGIALFYKAARPDDALISLRNNTGHDLHNCLIITEMSVDKSKLFEKAAHHAESEVSATILAALFGIDSATLAENAKLQSGYWAWQAINKGTIVFVEEWKKDMVLDVGVSPASTVTMAGSEAHASLYSDEGTREFSLSVSSMQDAIRKEFSRQAQSRSQSSHAGSPAGYPQKVTAPARQTHSPTHPTHPSGQPPIKYPTKPAKPRR